MKSEALEIRLKAFHLPSFVANYEDLGRRPRRPVGARCSTWERWRS